jgi:hypothetical protein
MQNIVLHMMNFQHVHNIKGARNTNAKCLHDLLKKHYSDKAAIEVYPAIVTSYNNEDASNSSAVVHLVVLFTKGESEGKSKGESKGEGKDKDEEEKVLLDPSYDVFSLENKRYYLNIKEFVDAIDDADKKQDMLKNLATDFLLLMETGKQIIAGTFDHHNRELYEKQTEYVNLKCSLETL